MFIERRLKASNVIDLWQCEWEKADGAGARKIDLKKLGEEQPLVPDTTGPIAEVPAICWSYGRTLGNIAAFSPSLLGRFPAQSGDDAQLPCDFVDAGKFRSGAVRSWCRTHQTHWGTKADLESFEQFQEMRCANHTQLMNYVVSPLTIEISDYAEIGIWCSMPAALSTEQIVSRPPKIHVHVRPKVGGKKTIDRDFHAISLLYRHTTLDRDTALQRDTAPLFGSTDITRVNVTPPAAFEFVCGLEANRDMACINCSNCGYPHLDLADFARRPHRKHFCGNCGWDSTWSKEPIVSTPLKPLHDQYAKTLRYETPSRTLNLDDYAGCSFTVWASTPAILWTASRPQEFGIHVHVHDGPERIVDDTFGEVTLQGKALERPSLINAMVERSVI
jgi:hypothetical protein